MWLDGADRSRAHEKSVVIVVHAGVIFVPRGHELCRIAGKEKVLQINVPEHDLLMPSVEAVQAAVRVLLEKMEIRDVVLHAIGLEVAENTQDRKSTRLNSSHRCI